MITYNESYIKNRQEIPIATYGCKIQDADSPYIVALHCHKDFEILYIDSGCAEAIISGRKVLAAQGSMLFINPFEPHYIESKTGDFSHRCICFDPDMLTGQASITFEGMHYQNYFPDAKMLYPYFDLCYQAETAKDPGWTARVVGSMLVLFSLLTDCVDTSSFAKDNLFSKKILEILENHYSEPITSRTVAETFNYNNSYFCRLFKKVFACSFSEYLNLFRVSKAKILLADHSISQTSLLTGYSSVSYFSSAFRNVTGITPMKYKHSLTK